MRHSQLELIRDEAHAANRSIAQMDGEQGASPIPLPTRLDESRLGTKRAVSAGALHRRVVD